MGLNLWYPYFDQKWIVENIQIAYYMQQNALDVIGYFVLCYNSFESVLLVPQIGITFWDDMFLMLVRIILTDLFVSGTEIM